MLKAIIAEDEFHSRQRLKKLLEKHRDIIEIVAEAGDGKTALDLISKFKPDLVFLDIQMPEMTGIEVARNLVDPPYLIFITAFDKYAVDAFEVSGIDYLLKPTSQERLDKAIARVKQNYREDHSSFNQQMTDFFNKLQIPKPVSSLNRFSVKDGDEILLIPQEEVIFFKTDEKYLFLCTKTREFFYTSTLKELVEEVDENVFLRVHKKYLINVNQISKIKKNIFRDHCFIMNDKDKSELKIGRSHIVYFRL